MGFGVDTRDVALMTEGAGALQDPTAAWLIDGETVETVADFIFLGSKITLDVTAAMKFKDAYSWKESYDQHR